MVVVNVDPKAMVLEQSSVTVIDVESGTLACICEEMNGYSRWHFDDEGPLRTDMLIVKADF